MRNFDCQVLIGQFDHQTGPHNEQLHFYTVFLAF